MNQKKIEQIKSITYKTRTRYHGNTKKIGELTPKEIREIVAKKIHRELYPAPTYCEVKTDAGMVKKILKDNIMRVNTEYVKILIEGNTGIYLAHPYYQHRDYNKSRVLEKNEKNIKLMNLYNSILDRYFKKN